MPLRERDKNQGGFPGLFCMVPAVCVRERARGAVGVVAATAAAERAQRIGAANFAHRGSHEIFNRCSVTGVRSVVNRAPTVDTGRRTQQTQRRRTVKSLFVVKISVNDKRAKKLGVASYNRALRRLGPCRPNGVVKVKR